MYLCIDTAEETETVDSKEVRHFTCFTGTNVLYVYMHTYSRGEGDCRQQEVSHFTCFTGTNVLYVYMHRYSRGDCRQQEALRSRAFREPSESLQRALTEP
jgi:hypothetical protein